MGFQDDLRKADAAYIGPEEQWDALLRWIAEFVVEAEARGWEPREYPDWSGYRGPTVLGWQNGYGGGRDGRCYVTVEGEIWIQTASGSLHGPCQSLAEARINSAPAMQEYLIRLLVHPEMRH
jgi:hypothetical protein